ncbi:RPII140-upstream gene protein-like [Sitodiplosis mosellana]|uniref:RPII140-upstream gene protein-like n=1 Tax=Sitodiplosis mosellana TaxID=263140 RepID=UPI002444C9AB|nr:RPII140-upstream gene protein-like [Sitodiplosis mosellana]
MLGLIFGKAGNVLHSTLIPVVHAQEVQMNQSTNDSVWERLKAITNRNEYGGLSQEMASMIAYVQNSIIIGVAIGGSIFTKNQYMDFMENASASQYKWHTDAKADLTNKMVKGGIRGALTWGVKSFYVSITFATLINFIPVFRNEHSWQEFITAGLVSGTLAGYLFSDPVALGFETKKHTGKYSYRTQCILKGTGYGLIFGALAGVYSLHSGNRLSANELKKWEQYWKQRLGTNQEKTE